jgi:transcription elongation factor Elf1
MQNKNQADKNESADGEQSLKKRFKCFNCGEDHYINNCLEFL